MNSTTYFPFQSFLLSKTLLTLPMLLLSFHDAGAASGDVDQSFNPGSTIDGAVSSMVVQADGKVIIGGDFRTTHDAVCRRIARLNPDGSADRSFLGHVTDADYAYVSAIAQQSDGKVVLSGWFKEVNGVARTNLARLNPDGSLDTAFLLDLEGWVDQVGAQPDGKILVGGGFNAVNGVSRTNLARLNNDGSVDVTFDVALENLIDPVGPEPGGLDGITLQADGKILIGGSFTSVNGVARTNIARLNSDGSLDLGFSVNLDWQGADGYGSGYAVCFAVQSDARILVGGGFTSVNGLARTNLVRLNKDGSVDPSFDCPLGDGGDETYQVSLRADGRVAAIGGFILDQIEAMPVVLLETNGTLVSTFDPPPLNGQSSVIAFHTNGNVLLGMTANAIGFSPHTSLSCLEDDGTVDSSFDTGGPTGPNNSITSLALEEDGRILIGGGYLKSVNGESHVGLARLNADGSLDSTFAPMIQSSDPNYPGSSGMSCLAVQADGKILLGGWFDSVNGVMRNGVARLHADGSLDASFLDGLTGVEGGFFGVRSVYAIAVQTNGQILIGGNFTQVNGQPRSGIARLNADGSVDGGFDAQLGNAVTDLAIQTEGKILAICGDRLHRLNPDGTGDGILWSSDRIWCFAVEADGKIVVGGWFSTLGGQPCDGFGRVNPDFSFDHTFLGTVSGEFAGVRQLAVDADGKLVMAGNFTAVCGVGRTNLARLHPDGSLDTSFIATPNTGGYSVNAIVIQPDTRILLSGGFTAINESARGYVARLMGSLVAPAIQSPPQSHTAEIGGDASFTVTAVGHPQVTYQWYFNGTNLLAGGTNRSLQLREVNPAQAGSYTVVISNAGGSITCAPVFLSVITPVERRFVPAVRITADSGSTINLEYSEDISDLPVWQPLASLSLTNTSQFYFDLTEPLPQRRFYRAWQLEPLDIRLVINLQMIPALTLSGTPGDSIRVDGINAVGPTDAWFTLATVTMTNTSQLYFDVTAPGQPARLYRLVPVP